MKQGEWTGRILLEPQGGIFLGQGGETPVHAHHSFKLVVALEGTVRVASARRGPLRGRIMVVHPNEPHAVLARDARLALIYVEPQSVAGRCLEVQERRHRGSAWGPDAADELVETLATSPPGTLPGASELIGRRLQTIRPRPLDPRVRRVVERLDRAAPGEDRIPGLAESSGLSASRLSHLFAEGLGISMVRYRRWRHLRRAMNQLAAGVGVTTAAHATGFSDAAHLCRTFVQMIGVTPGMFARMQPVGAGNSTNRSPEPE